MLILSIAFFCFFEATILIDYSCLQQIDLSKRDSYRNEYPWKEINDCYSDKNCFYTKVAKVSLSSFRQIAQEKLLFIDKFVLQNVAGMILGGYFVSVTKTVELTYMQENCRILDKPSARLSKAQKLYFGSIMRMHLIWA